VLGGCATEVFGEAATRAPNVDHARSDRARAHLHHAERQLWRALGTRVAPRVAILRVATRKAEQPDLWCDRLVGRPGPWGDSAELDAAISPLDELFERMTGQSRV